MWSSSRKQTRSPPAASSPALRADEVPAGLERRFARTETSLACKGLLLDCDVRAVVDDALHRRVALGGRCDAANGALQQVGSVVGRHDHAHAHETSALSVGLGSGPERLPAAAAGRWDGSPCTLQPGLMAGSRARDDQRGRVVIGVLTGFEHQMLCWVPEHRSGALSKIQLRYGHGLETLDDGRVVIRCTQVPSLVLAAAAHRELTKSSLAAPRGWRRRRRCHKAKDTMTSLRFLGHASFEFRGASATVVTDPWFSGSGAFFSAWAPFPANDHIDCDEVRSADFIVVSHGHEDHLDLDFLRSCSDATTIVVPRYPSESLYKMLRSELHQRIVLAEDRRPLELAPDVTVVPVIQSVPIWEDCAFVFVTPGLTVLDANDMKISASDAAWIRQSFAIDMVLAQFSGANWHPAIYDYDDDHKARLAKSKVARKFRSVINMADLVGASVIVPCAGPACFLDESQFGLNFGDSSIFPNQDVFYRYAETADLASKVVVSLPGDYLWPGVDLSELTAKSLAAPPLVDREAYLREYQARRRPAIEAHLAAMLPVEESLLGRCEDYFGRLMEASPWLCSKVGCRVLLEVDLTESRSEAILLDFTGDGPRVRLHAGEEVAYRFNTEGRFLREVLDGRCTFEHLLLSLRIKASRNPDRFNEHLMVFFRFSDPSQFELLREYEESNVPQARFELIHDGKKLSVQRMCPHAGGDLARGHVEDGCVVCPVHGWRFSLIDGQGSVPGYRIAID